MCSKATLFTFCVRNFMTGDLCHVDNNYSNCIMDFPYDDTWYFYIATCANRRYYVVDKCLWYW